MTMQFGEYIKNVRKQKKLTLREAAELCGISHPYLSQLETGRNTNPTSQVIEKLSNGLGIPNGTLYILVGHLKDSFKEIQNETEKKISLIAPKNINIPDQKYGTGNGTTYDTIEGHFFDLFFLLHMDKELYFNGKQISEEDKKKILKLIEISLN